VLCLGGGIRTNQDIGCVILFKGLIIEILDVAAGLMGNKWEWVDPVVD
jgi:hypothetical protein